MQMFMAVIDTMAKLGVVVAATGLIISARTRREDLRWRKATAARDYLCDIHNNPHSADAVEMIDCIRQQRAYTPHVSCEGLNAITEDTLRAAFNASPKVASAVPELTLEQKSHIRQRFDWLLYYMDRIAYLGSEGMLDVRDFAAPLAPYSRFVRDNWIGCFEVQARLQNYKFLGGELSRMADVR